MKKILIVDHDQQVTAILELKLKQANFEVKVLSRTVNALKTVKEFAPDMIISEMVLPELSGTDFLKRVKMNPETSSIPFIFLSSSRNVEDKIIALEMGAEAFFMKPIFIKVLIQRIKDFFEQKGFNEMLSLSRKKTEFKGDLTNISLIDILNIISENNSTGSVSLQNSNGEQAFVYFQNGSVIRIETEGGSNKSGEEEMYALLAWLDGSFTMTYGDVNVVRNVRVPHDRLVIKAVSWLDDYTGELSEMPPMDTKLYLDFGKFINGINKFPDRVSEIIRNVGANGTRLSDIIDRVELDRKQTVSYLKKLIDSDIIAVEKRNTDFILPEKPEWIEHKTPSSPKNIQTQTQKDPGSTLVPPPDLIQKDTIDPAVGISFGADQVPDSKKKGEVPKPGLIDSSSFEPEKLDALKEKKEDKHKKTLDFKEDGQPETILDSHTFDIEIDSEKNEKKPSPHYSRDPGPSKGKLTAVFFLIFIILSAVVIVHLYFPEKFQKTVSVLSSYVGFGSVETKEDVFLEKKEDFVKAESEDRKKEKVFSNMPEEIVDLPVEKLIDKAASLYEEDRVDEAANVNKVALYKLKDSEEKKEGIYEKVVSNMAIYLYTLERGEEALQYAREALELREDSRSIELNVAILDLLGRKTEAASFLRSKIDLPEYKKNRKAWIREINRLENLE